MRRMHFPLNPLDWTDTDSDDVGDNTDAFGLDPGLQSLAVDDALGFVTDPSLSELLDPIDARDGPRSGINLSVLQLSG